MTIQAQIQNLEPKPLLKNNIMKKSGFLSYILIIVGVVFTTSFAFSSSLFIYQHLNIQKTEEKSKRASILADACAEKALGLVQATATYTGSGSTTLDGFTCTYTVFINTSSQKEIRVRGTVEDFEKETQIILSSVSPMTILSWNTFFDW